MPESSRGGFAPAVILLVALVLAVGDVAVFARAGHGDVSLDSLVAAWNECWGCVVFLAAAPLVVATLAAVLSEGRSRAGEVAIPAAATPPAPSPDAALRLLGLLQHEGRLIDFLEEDIAGYSDMQIGAAVRSIHEGCRKVLRERITLERVIDREDGASVDVAAGFDPAAIRLTGNVTGTPPFRGTLQHAGWRAAKANLPQSSTDPTILAPAEVEIA
ncbi:MAG TPA: DUF2760 domain-containing protein [Candidatus Binatia bacterium]|nr:DUF2760 domain-containing protein [Candidatus Binatia bacterium]